jgi:hypothetical protein
MDAFIVFLSIKMLLPLPLVDPPNEALSKYVDLLENISELSLLDTLSLILAPKCKGGNFKLDLLNNFFPGKFCCCCCCCCCCWTFFCIKRNKLLKNIYLIYLYIK